MATWLIITTIILGLINIPLSIFLVNHCYYSSGGDEFFEVPKIFLPIAIITGFIPILNWIQMIVLVILFFICCFDPRYLKDTKFITKYFPNKEGYDKKQKPVFKKISSYDDWL